MHDIVIFNDGLASLEQRLQMIERAQHTIDVEYFLFDPAEGSARLIIQALMAKARQGVQVNILVDGLGILLKLDKYLAAEFARVPNEKIQLKLFNKSFIWEQKRNHRKHLIVDGKIAGIQEVISGGRNLEDKYFDLDPRYNFMDRDAWVRGPIVSDIKETFDLLWNDPTFATSSELGPLLEQIKIPKKKPQFARGGRGSQGNRSQVKAAEEKLSKAQAARRIVTVTAEDRSLRQKYKFWSAKQAKRLGRFRGPVTYVSDYFYRGPWGGIKKNLVIWDCIKKVLNETSESLIPESPYMVLGAESFREMHKLKHDGELPVQIVALTNSPRSTDNKLTSTTFFGLSDDVARAGGRVLVYNGDVPSHIRHLVPPEVRGAKWGTHAKTMIFDNTETAIGTFNMDPRSKNLNLESAFYFPRNPKLAEFVVGDVRDRMVQSYEFFIVEDGVTKKQFSDCEQLKTLECVMLRLQRPLGFIFKRLL